MFGRRLGGRYIWVLLVCVCVGVSDHPGHVQPFYFILFFRSTENMQSASLDQS